MKVIYMKCYKVLTKLSLTSDVTNLYVRFSTVTVVSLGLCRSVCQTERLFWLVCRLYISTSSLCAVSLCIPTSSWLAHHTLLYLIMIQSFAHICSRLLCFLCSHKKLPHTVVAVVYFKPKMVLFICYWIVI